MFLRDVFSLFPHLVGLIRSTRSRRCSVELNVSGKTLSGFSHSLAFLRVTCVRRD